MRLVGRTCSLAAVVLLCGVTSSYAQAHKVRTTFETSAWLTEATFPKTAVVDVCASAGVTLAPSTERDAVGTLKIRYDASQGRPLPERGQPLQYATKIAYRFEFSSRSAQPDKIVFTARTETPEGVTSESPARAAVQAFARLPEVGLACSAIAGAMGDRTAVSRLLPWTVTSKRALDLVKDIGFEPATPADRAYLLVARRQFDEAASMGAVGVAPLSLLFIATAGPILENRGPVEHIDPKADADMLVRAAGALAKIGDPSATAALLVFLHDYASASNARHDSQDYRVVMAVLDALGQVGDPLAVPVLEAWKPKVAPLGPAAGRALDSIKRRHNAP